MVSNSSFLSPDLSHSSALSFYLIKPYGEGWRNITNVFGFNVLNKEGLHRGSLTLTSRASHFVVGALLLVPVVNAVALAVLFHISKESPKSSNPSIQDENEGSQQPARTLSASTLESLKQVPPVVDPAVPTVQKDGNEGSFEEKDAVESLLPAAEDHFAPAESPVAPLAPESESSFSLPDARAEVPQVTPLVAPALVPVQVDEVRISDVRIDLQFAKAKKPLEKALLIVQTCIEALEKKRTENPSSIEEGLFRRSGDTTTTNNWVKKTLSSKKSLNSEHPILQKLSTEECHNIASFMKKALTAKGNYAGLHLSGKQYKGMMDLFLDEATPDIETLKAAFEMLSPEYESIYKIVLLYLNGLLDPAIQRVTKMDARNLSVVWGPLFFSTADPEQDALNATKHNTIIQFIIERAKALFLK